MGATVFIFQRRIGDEESQLTRLIKRIYKTEDFFGKKRGAPTVAERLRTFVPDTRSTSVEKQLKIVRGRGVLLSALMLSLFERGAFIESTSGEELKQGI